MKVLALTTSKNTPSSRFRIRQYTDVLAEYDVRISESYPTIQHTATPRLFRRPRLAMRLAHRACRRLPEVYNAQRFDLVWLSRQLVQGIPTFERWIRAPLVLDVDDAVWMARPLGKQTAIANAKLAHLVIAGNSYLADWFRQYTESVIVVPTCVDLTRFHKRQQSWQPTEPFVVGWTGTKSTLPYLTAIEAQLWEFLRHRENAQLMVVADVPPTFKTIPAHRVKFVPWTAATEASLVAEMTVGLMPLTDDEWARGKCAAKMIQYMACGVVPVVSSVGANIDVLRHENVGFGVTGERGFLEVLVRLHAAPSLVQEVGDHARYVAEHHYSVQAHAPKLAQRFQQIVGDYRR